MPVLRRICRSAQPQGHGQTDANVLLAPSTPDRPPVFQPHFSLSYPGAWNDYADVDLQPTRSTPDTSMSFSINHLHSTARSPAAIHSTPCPWVSGRFQHDGFNEGRNDIGCARPTSYTGGLTSYICRGPFVAAESAFVRLCGQLQTANVGFSKAGRHSSTLPHFRSKANTA